MKTVISLVSVLLLSFATNPAMADFSFGTPINLGPQINSPNSDFTGCVSADGLSLYFASNRDPGGYQDFDLWIATRSTIHEDWGTAIHMGDTLNSRENEWSPSLSADGLELYYAKGPWGNTDIVVSRRNGLTEPWGPPENLGSMINSNVWDGTPSITEDGLELYFDSTRSGSPDLYVSTRATPSDPWGPAINLGPNVNSTHGNSLYGDQGPNISPDGLTLFFSSARPPGSASNTNIWMTTRATRQAPWETPVPLGGPINSYALDMTPSIPANASMLYFVSGRPGGVGGDSDFWQAPILPTVDFNGDGMVSIEDLITLIEHWGQDVPSLDMGPTPFGDGTVDAADLEVLMNYWGQEVYDPHLLALWKLNETEGDIAYDSAAENDAPVMGNAMWQGDGGQVDGALQFDGDDDYISTGFVLNPISGSFSVFLWINGGIPGQTILSQENGVNWLMADADQGVLRSDLADPAHKGRMGITGGSPLMSQIPITDGNWHRVGFTWDGTNRTLYVDDVEVARNTLTELEGSEGSLLIGADSTLEPGTFWSGMIDDVRICNRVIAP